MNPIALENPLPRWHCNLAMSINSMGLPNAGRRQRPQVPQAPDHGATGMSFDDTRQVLERLSQIPAGQSPAYDTESMRKYLELISGIVKVPWGVKLPPFFDPVHFEVAQLTVEASSDLRGMAVVMRKLVSKKKRRFEWGGFDLDLSYITDRIIAMGFPSESIEGLYRNKMTDVVKFLDALHKDHYKVYNLCTERKYDHSKFYGRVAEYAFDDHDAPTLELVGRFCADVGSWLDAHAENVAVVHCKAGKGRTGTMIACFMLWSRVSRTASEAMRVYGQKRTTNGKGVTIPSQQRFVRYFGQCLARADGSYAEAGTEGERLAHPAVAGVGSPAGSPRGGIAQESRRYSSLPLSLILPPVTAVVLKRIEMHTVPRVEHGHCEPWIAINQRNMTVYKSKPLKGSRGDGVMSIPCDNTIISNETRIQFFHKTSKCKMFAFTIHTAFVGENLCLWKHDLDAACKDTSHKTFSPNFYIQLFFKEFSNDDEEDAVRCCTCGKIINKGDLSVHCGQNAWHWSCTFCSSCKQHVGDKCTFDSSDQPLCVR
eukprot:m51a1_g12103 putative lim-type zinc finger-containing protein (540) ;mRNA; r:257-3202